MILGAILDDPVCPKVCEAGQKAELVKGGRPVVEGLLGWALET